MKSKIKSALLLFALIATICLSSCGEKKLSYANDDPRVIGGTYKGMILDANIDQNWDTVIAQTLTVQVVNSTTLHLIPVYGMDTVSIDAVINKTDSGFDLIIQPQIFQDRDITIVGTQPAGYCSYCTPVRCGRYIKETNTLIYCYDINTHTRRGFQLFAGTRQ